MTEQTKAEEAKRQSRGWDDAMDSASIAEAIGEIGGALRVLENASRKQKNRGGWWRGDGEGSFVRCVRQGKDWGEAISRRAFADG